MCLKHLLNINTAAKLCFPYFASIASSVQMTKISKKSNEKEHSLEINKKKDGKKRMKIRNKIFVINTPQGLHLLELNIKDKTILKKIKLKPNFF